LLKFYDFERLIIAREFLARGWRSSRGACGDCLHKTSYFTQGIPIDSRRYLVTSGDTRAEPLAQSIAPWLNSNSIRIRHFGGLLSQGTSKSNPSDRCDGSKWSWAFALVVVLRFALGYGISCLLARALQFAAWTRGYSLGYALAGPLPAALWSRWIRLFIWRSDKLARTRNGTIPPASKMSKAL
jgi:hypothetical protein